VCFELVITHQAKLSVVATTIQYLWKMFHGLKTALLE